MVWLSIIIPAYNRARTLGRSIDSCLRGQPQGCEIVVVDDASTDKTSEVLLRYRTTQLQTITMRQNVGVSAARMAGVEAAVGEWVLFLDSDDELMPNALSILEQRCQQVSTDIARLATMCLHDDGSLSPKPWKHGAVMDYPTYLKWSESASRSDFNNCIRRSSFKVVRFSLDRVYETLYHLDFAKEFKTLCCGEIIARVHADAHDRLTMTGTRLLSLRLLSEAQPRMHFMCDILERHGEALLSYAPLRERMVRRASITSALMANQRRVALHHFLIHIRRHPLSLIIWGLTIIGLVSPRTLSWLIASRKAR
jgi:glycosyltransferase involved in cell wall biosynthesis